MENFYFIDYKQLTILLKNTAVLSPRLDIADFFGPEVQVCRTLEQLQAEKVWFCFWDMDAFSVMEAKGATWICFFSQKTAALDESVCQSSFFVGLIHNLIGSPHSISQMQLLSSLLGRTYSGIQISDHWNKVHQDDLHHTDQKHPMIQTFLEKSCSQISNRKKKHIITALDEVIMNAIFDAPGTVDVQAFSQRLRSGQFPLEGKSRISLTCFLNASDTLIFQIRDYYGTLNIQSVLLKMTSSFKEKNYVLSEKQQNAGLGMMGIFNMGTSIWMHCCENQFTDIYLIFSLALPNRELKTALRFVLVSQEHQVKTAL